MLEQNGDVVTRHVPNTRRLILEPHILEYVEAGSEISTDEHGSYTGLNRLRYKHDSVTHSIGEYVDGNCHINNIEGF